MKYLVFTLLLGLSTNTLAVNCNDKVLSAFIIATENCSNHVLTLQKPFKESEHCEYMRLEIKNSDLLEKAKKHDCLEMLEVVFNRVDVILDAWSTQVTKKELNISI